MRKPAATLLALAGNIAAIVLTLVLAQAAYPAVQVRSPVSVRDLKLWSDHDSAKIVVYLSSVTNFKGNRLHDPERFYVDLKNARIDGNWENEVRANAGPVKSVRAGQFDAGTVRIVADLERKKYSDKVDLLNDPPRLVIEISAPASERKVPDTRETVGRGGGAANRSQVAAQEKGKEASSSESSSGVPKQFSYEAGLKAEREGQWQKALEIYRSAAKNEPENADLWKKIGDIEWSLGDAAKAADAYQKEADLSPRDAVLLARLSRAYAVANEPAYAFEPIRRAVELDPDNIEYLRALGQIANWNGRSDIAAESYGRIVKLSPGDETAQLDFARSLSWSGNLDGAVAAFRGYFEKHADKKDALIEYAEAEEWRGHFSAALKLLERYREKFGETKEYRKAMARLLALAARPTPALKLIGPLLKESPDDYDVNYSNTIALYYAHRIPEAVRSLQVLEKLRPQSRETYDVGRFVTIDVRSNVEAGFRFYSDSNHLSLYGTRLKGTYFIDPDTYLQARGEYDYLHADRGSGYEALDGSTFSWHTAAWIGGGRRLSPALEVHGSVGAASVKDGSTIGIYDVSFEWQAADELLLKLTREHGYYVISPRTLSLGIKSDANRLNLTWQPDLDYTIDSSVSYVTLSDDNNYWDIAFTPHRSVLRCEKFNLDLGVTGSWQTFDKTLSNGYYSPELEQRYAAIAFGYWKINDDNGVSLTTSLGAQKDNTMNGFRFSYDVSAEGTFGIYRDWMLKVNAGYSHNVRQASGAFDAVGGGLSVVRRF